MKDSVNNIDEKVHVHTHTHFTFMLVLATRKELLAFQLK